MSIGSIIAGLILAIVAVVYTLYPLFAKTVDSGAAFINRQRERALAYYERVLTNIRDLDEDRATGKIDDSEYQAERDIWMERGVRLLKLLDELDLHHNIVDDARADDAEIDAAIERAIRDARKMKTQGSS